jgi:GntR family transcriptional regulator
VAHYRLELGPVPLHHQVYLHLRSSLDSGELQPGERLPPERTLAQRYGCSVITIRRALDELSREQRIQRTRGRGTFVLPRRVDLDIAGTMSFAEEMRIRGLAPETRLVTACAETAGESAAAALEIRLGSPIFTIARVRLADGTPLLLEEVSLPADRFPGLLDEDLESGSLYDILADRYGAQIVRAREALEPVLLRAREARLLDVPPGRPALLVEGVAFVSDGTAVEYSRSHVRGDRTRYYVERVVARESWQSRSLDREPALAASGGAPGGSSPSTRLER